MNTLTNITALILAGGEGRRVNRQNKGLLPFRGKPLIHHVINCIQPKVQTILISANDHIPEYESFGFPVYRDLPQWKGKGPLAGIISVFSQAPSISDLLLILPCDTPLLPAHLVTILTKSLQSDPELMITYAATPETIHPSIFLCKSHINHQLANHLDQQRYSLKSWIFSHPNLKVVFPDDHAFTNMNDFKTLTDNQ